MKTATKIIAYCVWLGLVILFSIYCDGIFSKLVDLIEKKIIRTEIPPAIDFAISIIPWNCLISLLVCLPLWLMKKRRANAASEIGEATVYFFILLSWNLFGVMHLWIFFPESIGNYSGLPSLSVIKPYAINEGWSSFELWCAWWGFIIVSNASSAVMAFLIGQPRKSKTSKPLLWS
jgi:hypothetical protein